MGCVVLEDHVHLHYWGKTLSIWTVLLVLALTQVSGELLAVGFPSYVSGGLFDVGFPALFCGQWVVYYVSLDPYMVKLKVLGGAGVCMRACVFILLKSIYFYLLSYVTYLSFLQRLS